MSRGYTGLSSAKEAFFLEVRLERGTFAPRGFPTVDGATFVAECLTDRGFVQGSQEDPHARVPIEAIHVVGVRLKDGSDASRIEKRVVVAFEREGEGFVERTAQTESCELV